MSNITRRSLLQSAALMGCATRLDSAVPKVPIGVTDWNLRLGAKPEALPLAAELGFDGVQISFGRQIADGKMPLDNPEIIARYRRLSGERKIPINGTCVDRLHDNGLKSDKLALKWVQDGIRLTNALGVQALLLPFFGKWAIQNESEGDYVGDVLRDLGPEAEKAGVILALEDTISAESNARIMERSRSQNVKVYYDTGNSAAAGFDVVKEIHWLGSGRICQFHFKDNPHYLGEGKLPFPQIVQAIRDIGFTGCVDLETDTHQGSSVEADMRRNLAYVRGLMRG